MSVYLDYNATAPIDSRVLETMVDAYKNHYGNADSRTHDFGNDSREIVEKARGQVAQLLNVSKGEVFFTSGATESTNIAILGLQEYGEQTGKKHIVTTSFVPNASITKKNTEDSPPNGKNPRCFLFNESAIFPWCLFPR